MDSGAVFFRLKTNFAPVAILGFSLGKRTKRWVFSYVSLVWLIIKPKLVIITFLSFSFIVVIERELFGDRERERESFSTSVVYLLKYNISKGKK